MSNNLVDLRKQAEAAVRDMPDGDLKLKAFETVLRHLLSNSPPGATETAAAKKAAPSKSKKPATSLVSFAERVLSLKEEGFFEEQRSIAEIRQELKKNGWHYPVTSMSGPLQTLVQKKELRRERVDDGKGRKGWKYSNP